MSNDKETVKRTVSDDDNDQQLQDLSTHFLNLRLRDRNSQLPSEIEAFQNAAMALPANFPADLPNEPTETNNRNNSNNGQGAIPRIYARTFTNSLSDTEIRTPRFRSNFARDLQTNRESRRFTGNDFNNRNFNRQQQQQSPRTANNNNNFFNNNYANNNQLNQSINDILQMAVLVSNFDGTEDTFENFEVSCLDAGKILSVPNQKIFMKFLRDKFIGPIKLYMKVKLDGYNDITQMLDDIKQNFMVRTPIHLLENKIYSSFQTPEESVKEFGAKLSNLQNILSNRIKDKFRGYMAAIKIVEAEKKIRKQFIQGLKRDLYVQFSLVDFRDSSLDQIIQAVAKVNQETKLMKNSKNLPKK